MPEHGIEPASRLWADKTAPEDNRLKSAHLSYGKVDAHIDYVGGTLTITDMHGGEACIRFEHIPQVADAITSLANRINVPNGTL